MRNYIKNLRSKFKKYGKYFSIHFKKCNIEFSKCSKAQYPYGSKCKNRNDYQDIDDGSHFTKIITSSHDIILNYGSF